VRAPPPASCLSISTSFASLGALKAPRLQVVAQQLFPADFLPGEMPGSPAEAFFPPWELLSSSGPTAAPDEVAGQRLVGVALILDPLELVLARIGEDRAARRLSAIHVITA